MSVKRTRPLPTPKVDSYGHYESLDGLRAFAILAVMVFHLPADGDLRGGYLGVDVFFVLSGFLITSLLIGEIERSGRISLASFYMRRVLRLLPALFAVIAVAVVLATTVPGVAGSAMESETLKWLWATVFFVGNWPHTFDPNAQGLLQQTWSLAVEEQFYLIWPFVFLVAFARIRHFGAFFIVGAAAILLMIYSYGLMLHGWSVNRIYFGTDTHCSGLIAGCAIAFLLASGRLPTKPSVRRAFNLATIAGVLLLFAMMRLSNDVNAHVMVPCVSLAVIATAITVVNQIVFPIRPLRAVLESRLFRWIGKRSYGLYIWHLPIYYSLFTVPFIVRHYLTYGAVILFGSSFIMAALSYRYLEQPIIKRWKWRYQRTEALPGVPPTSAS
jgi:peptidoglycan/LPS O-acetylase OafA/YrhL